MDLQGYLDKFCTSKLSEGRSPQTIVIYREKVGHFLKWCAAQEIGESDMIGQIGAEVIEEFLFSLQTKGLSLATSGLYFRCLRAVYKWIFDRYEDEVEGKIPFKWLKHPTRPELLPKNISLNQVYVLLHSIKGPTRRGDPAWVPVRDRLMIKTLFNTGLRSAELLSLKVSDIDTDRRLLRVVRWKIHQESFVPIAKSMVPEFQEWLEIYRPKVGDGLWPARQNGRASGDYITQDGLRQMLRRRCTNAGIPIFRAHAFRHGCAIAIIQRGGDISLVQKILGHRSIETSQVYLRYDMGTVISLYDRVFD